LTKDPDERPDAQMALKHPWLQKMAQINKDESKMVNCLDNMLKFQTNAVLKRAGQTYIASQLLDKEKKQEMAEVFKAFDTNGDGKLSMDEVSQGYLDHYGKVISEREVQELFKKIDTDNTGFIGYTEFIVASIE